MKFNAYNQRRRQREGGPSISLFPFLAVLICTMGALVPLLFAITRQARLQAAQESVAKLAERKAELQTQRETTKWRTEQLKTSREKTLEQQADARLELGHLEDHARRLRDKIPMLEKTVAELDKLGKDDHQKRSDQFEELEKLRTKIEAMKKEITEAQMEAASRKKSYAVVPFEGPNQTHRRPIYLECRADAVVLQPEGIEFLESDFEGPLGPGNPLASSIRAVREYMLSKRQFDPQRDGEPYPLLLVRPQGVAAYYAAREAMKSWATEFGYEFVNADWKLAYQQPDAQLAQLVQQELVSARARQQRLIAAAPRAYVKQYKSSSRTASGRSGTGREYGPGGDEDNGEDSDYIPRPTSGRVGRGYTAAGSAGNGGNQDDSSGMTEAEQLASIYGGTGGGKIGLRGQVPGNAGTGGYGPRGAGNGGYGSGGTIPGGNAISGTAARGGVPGGSTAGGNGENSGDGVEGPALGGGGIGNATGHGSPGGAYAAGSGASNNYGTGTAGTANSFARGVKGTTGGGNGSNTVETGTGTGSGTGYAGTDIAGQGTSNGAMPVAGGTASNQNSGINGGKVAGGNIVQDSGSVAGMGNGSAGNIGNGGISQSGSYSVVNGNTGISGGSQATNGQGVSGGQTSLPEGYIIGQPPSEPEETTTQKPPKESDADNQMIIKQSAPLRPGEWQEKIKPPPVKPVEEKLDGKKNGKPTKKPPNTRGRDWGLPDSGFGSVPVTRPIKIECQANQLIILPESGTSVAKNVTLGARTDASIQAFVSAIWDHMDSWGIAGRGMYWRPILNVHVAPGAEQRFEELASSLEGSGLKVVRK
jgi:hypothetical protein